MFLVLGFDRGVTFCLAIFIILMMSFLSRMPVLGRNVLVHAFLYSLFFLSITLGSILRSMFGLKLYASIDTGLMGVAAACAFAWFFLLNRRGEEVTVSLPNFSPEQEQRVLYQLEAINATLMKVGAKT
jgi:hypothetical protein